MTEPTGQPPFFRFLLHHFQIAYDSIDRTYQVVGLDFYLDAALSAAYAYLVMKYYGFIDESTELFFIPTGVQPPRI